MQKLLPNSTSQALSGNGSSSKDDSELVSWINSEYQRMRSARSKIQLGWYLNMAMYSGNQYVELIPSLQKLGIPKLPPYRVRLISNRIKPIIRKEIARITSQKPNASVIPASSEDEDLYAAYAAESMWESMYETNAVAKKFRRSAWWLCITGTSFMKIWWDGDSPDVMGTKGTIQYSPVTPFHLYVPDLREQELEEQPYILNVYTKPVSWVERFYKINAKPDVVAANEIMNDAYLNLNTGTSTAPDSVLCKEMWFKPGGHRLLPDGGVIHVISDKVVSRGSLYSHGMYPFVKFEHIPSGKFYTTSVIDDLTPLQREYNRTRSQITEAKNRTAKPQFLAASGSIDAKKWTTEPGLIIEYRVGLPEPKPMPIQPLPAYVVQELDRHISDMEDISGQHEVSKGNAPPGVTAATAISYLQEQDDSLMSTTYSSIEDGFKDMAKQTLNLAVQYWDMPRAVKVVGDDETFDLLMLAGSDLKSGTDIRMEGGSALPTSRAARQAFLMDMMKMQFISPQDGLKLLDMGGVTKLWQRLRIDDAQAQRENIKLKSTDPNIVMQMQQQKQQIEAMMSQGGPMPPGVPTDPQSGQPLMPPPVLPVNSWDNHDVHVQRHNDFRKSETFEKLPDPIKTAFEEHVNMHLAIISQSMQQVQGITGGMPPGNQGGSPVAASPSNSPAPQGNEMGAPPNG